MTKLNAQPRKNMWTVICRFDNTRIEASEPDSKGMVILRVVSGDTIRYASIPHGTITQGWKYSSANNIAHCGPLMVRFRKDPPTPSPELIEVNLTHRLVGDIRFDSVFRINRIRLNEPSVPCDGDNYILAYDNEAEDHPQKVPITIREIGVVKVSEKQFVLDKLITFEPVYAKIIAIYYNGKFQRVEAQDITFIGYSP